MITFDNAGRLPLTALKLEPREGNRWLQASLFSRNDAEQPWRYRGRFSQYRFELKGNRLDSEPWSLAGIRDTHWRLEFEPSLDMRSLDDWSLALAWTAQRAAFLRQGDGPYTLAWGNPGVEPASADLSALVADLEPSQLRQMLMEPALVEATQVLGGEERLAPAWTWRPWLLWSSLLAAVAVMLWMATSLWRQMKPG